MSISASLARFLVEGGLVPAGKSGVVPYGFDFGGVVSKAGPGTRRFGTLQVIVPGRVVPVKQPGLLIDVLPALVRDFPELVVVFVGAGPLLDALRQRTQAMGLERHVRWEGFRDNIHDYLRDSDLAVVPSAAEGFGLVVLEAWHHEIPVVAFDVPAINEIIESGRDGILVPPFDTARLLASIRGLLEDTTRRTAMGKAGQSKQVREYGLDAMCDRMLAIYRDVLAGDGLASEACAQ